MKTYNGINICSARNLEVGDLFAAECIGGVFHGEIVGRIYDEHDHNETTRLYVEEKDLGVPGDGSGSRTLLFIVTMTTIN